MPLYRPAALARFLGRLFNRLLEPVGLELRRLSVSLGDVYSEREFMEIYRRCRPFTMTSIERVFALWQAVRYIEARRIPGAFVECGVWRGGSAMCAALTLRSLGSLTREIWLYDTFSGMTASSERDRTFSGVPAAHFQPARRAWHGVAAAEVRANLLSTGYPEDKIRLVEGDVRETLAVHRPDRIALLRLDTDWYDSTRAEMEALFPLLVPGGVLIIDDYGDYAGAKEAVDEYLEAHGVAMLLDRADRLRIGIKPA